MRGRFRTALAFVRALMVKWGKDDVNRLAAAVAFFAALSLGPMLLIATVIASALLDQGSVKEEVAARAEQVLGSEAAAAVSTILENVSLPDGGVLPSLVALAGFAFAASNIFVQLQRALDEIWDVAPDPRYGLRARLRGRAEAFVGVLAVGLLLAMSPVLSLIYGRLSDRLIELLPGVPWLWSLLDSAVVVAIYAFLFGVIFKVVPRVRISWRAVTAGALLTAVLFTISVSLLARYLESSATASLYGAAGSLMALLLWIYFSAQILFLGAEFVQLYARLRGEPIEPEGKVISSVDEQRHKREQVDALVRQLRGVAEGRE